MRRALSLFLPPNRLMRCWLAKTAFAFSRSLSPFKNSGGLDELPGRQAVVQREKLVQMALIRKSGRCGGISRRGGSEKFPRKAQAADALERMRSESCFFFEQAQEVPRAASCKPRQNLQRQGFFRPLRQQMAGCLYGRRFLQRERPDDGIRPLQRSGQPVVYILRADTGGFQIYQKAGTGACDNTLFFRAENGNQASLMDSEPVRRQGRDGEGLTSGNLVIVPQRGERDRSGERQPEGPVAKMEVPRVFLGLLTAQNKFQAMFRKKAVRDICPMHIWMLRSDEGQGNSCRMKLLPFADGNLHCPALP